MMKKVLLLLLLGVIGTVATLFLWPQQHALQSNDSSFQEKWLEAESITDPQHALELWQAFYQSLPQGQQVIIANGVTSEDVRKRLFTAYLNLSKTQKNASRISDAEALIPEQPINEYVWENLEIAQTLLPIDSRLAWRYIRKAETKINEIDDRIQRSYAIDGLVRVALSETKDQKLLFDWDGLELAQQWIPHITTAQSRAQILHRYALHARDDVSGLHETLRSALKTPLDEKKKRDKKLISIAEKARQEGNVSVALDAYSGIEKESTQQLQLMRWFRETFKQEEYSLAEMIAQRLDDGRYGAESWGKLAVYYHEKNQASRTKSAIERAYHTAINTHRDDRKVYALLAVAEAAAQIGNNDLADKALSQAPDILKGADASKAISRMIKSLAENEKIDQAKHYLATYPMSDPKDDSIARSALAKAMAENDQTDDAVAILGNQTAYTSNRDKAYYAIVKRYAEADDFDKARQFLSHIEDTALKYKAEAILIREEGALRQDPDAYYNNAITTLAANINKLPQAIKDEAFVGAGHHLVSVSAQVRDSWVNYIGSARQKDALQLTILKQHLANNETDDAIERLNSITDLEQWNEGLSLLSLQLAKERETVQASYLAQKVTDPLIRAPLFRQIAQVTAEQTDFYNKLSSSNSQQLSPRVTAKRDAEHDGEISSWEESLLTTDKQGSGKLAIDILPKSELGHYLPPFRNPERLGYNTQDIRDMLPISGPFTLNRNYYENNFFINSKFKWTINYATANTRESILTPEVLYLSAGTATLPQLYHHLQSIGYGDYLTRDGKMYNLRRGLVVGPEAQLIIDGNEVESLRLSNDYNAILVNAGDLYIVDTHIISWDDANDQPYRVAYEDRYEFRPFITSWGQSHSYFGGSEFIGLGYQSGKSYGISFTSGPEKMDSVVFKKAERPTGIIAENSFDNMYYGFYSYEADDVALIGNEYNKNIVYGIDPHDRSRHLTIAYNTAYESLKKHGIIISREVDDSSYIGNLSFNNHGSGFMIDRMSSGTYVYANTAFANEQDGMTLFESSCNLIASNRFSNNKRMGIRARNSQDNGLFFNILEQNRQGGVSAYTAHLESDPAHAHRDFELDPYGDVASLSLVGNYIAENGSGIIVDDLAAMTLSENQFTKQSPKILKGSWLKEHPHLTSQYNLYEEGLLIRQRCPKGQWLEYPCRFRENGTLLGDGQEHLRQHVTQPSCHQDEVT